MTVHVGWQQEPPNHCKEKVMQHFVAVSAQQILQLRLFSYNLSSRRCLVHVFGKMLIGAEIRRLLVFYSQDPKHRAVRLNNDGLIGCVFLLFCH